MNSKPHQPDKVWNLRQHAQQSPQRVVVSCDDKSLTYGELESLANKMARYFRSRGLFRGDHIALLIGNCPEMLAVVWGAWRAGLYITPMSTSLTLTELTYMVSDCDAKLVIVDVALGETSLQLASQLNTEELQFASVGGATPNCTDLNAILSTISDQPIQDESPGALMMYTSGTTGYPKGVIRPLPDASQVATPAFAADLITLFGMGGNEVRYLSTQPLYHAAALRFALAVTAGGGYVRIMPRFHAKKALTLLESDQITHSQWVPVMFQRLMGLPENLRKAFHAPKHRCAIHGAAPCSVSLKQDMIEWWGPIFLEYYSGSEGVGLSMIDSHEAQKHPGSVGRVVKGKLHVVENPDSTTELPPGQVGMLFFSGIAPFQYYKEPGKTAGRTHVNGWQTLGDLGHVDIDGYVYLSDRLDDMIISGGVNVYPQEIEKIISEVSGVDDCAVVGISNAEFGERPVAFVVPESAHSPASLIDRVRKHCEKHLERIKRPDRFELIVKLPRTPTGKLLRKQLRNYI
jgi:fatty-acyl-CoA synthase